MPRILDPLESRAWTLYCDDNPVMERLSGHLFWTDLNTDVQAEYLEKARAKTSETPKVRPWAPRQDTKSSVLMEAHGLIHGPRHEDYGHPLDDFARTGKMWAAILGLDTVTPKQVALCMAALKISRQCNKPKRDNIVDGCGYLSTIEMIQDERRTHQQCSAETPLEPY